MPVKIKNERKSVDTALAKLYDKLLSKVAGPVTYVYGHGELNGGIRLNLDGRLWDFDATAFAENAGYCERLGTNVCNGEGVLDRSLPLALKTECLLRYGNKRGFTVDA